MPSFVILMREDDNAWSRKPPEVQQRLLSQYFAWIDDLRARDLFKGGEPLNGGGRLLQLVDGEVVDGPFTETKEVLTGYFVIEAEGWDEAVAIAKSCPAVHHGEQIELRMVGHV